MNDLFLGACRRQPVARTPIWLMRQAGRYMPEYRAIREKHGFLQMLKTPELAVEITLQPVRAFGVDAAIIFADILPILEGLGLQLSYEKNEGPVIHNPITHAHDVAALRDGDPRDTLTYTLEAIRLAKRELEGKVPLIGFSGAPFTLASYAIEGGGSKDYRAVKRFMHTHSRAWCALMTKLAGVVSQYLIAQIEAGADAVQIFDSWAGALSPFDYAENVLPFVQQVIQSVRRATGGGTPDMLRDRQQPSSSGPAQIIYFGTDMSGMSRLLQQTGADVIGVDWRVNLDEVWDQLGDVAVQGNLDPAALLADWEQIEPRARDVLDRAGGRPGHIFNVGHGVMTDTPVENVRRLVEFVQSYPNQCAHANVSTSAPPCVDDHV